MKKTLFLLVVSSLLLPSLAKESVMVKVDKSEYTFGDSVWYSLTLSSDEPVVSKVVYIEWVGPEGYIAERHVRVLDNGKTSGAIAVKREESSGLFELRAYSRYMLAQDKENYFSAVFPVYEERNGRKCVAKRGDRENMYKLDYTPMFTISPEQRVEVRGKLINSKDNSRIYSGVEVTMITDGSTKTTRTDANGMFSFPLDRTGCAVDAQFVYGPEVEDKPMIILDEVFNIFARPYSKADKRHLDGYDVLKPERYESEFRHGDTIRTKELMSNYLDMSGGSEYFYRQPEQRSENFPVLYQALLPWRMSYDEPYRFLKAKAPMGEYDAMNDGLEVLDHAAKLIMDSYEYFVMSTDRELCEKYSYASYPPEEQQGNIEWQYADKTVIMGLGRFKKEPVPAAMFIYVPYPKETPIADRQKNYCENVRYAVIRR